MRKLMTSDVFAFCRVLKRSGAKEEIEKIAKESDTAKDAWSRGFDTIWAIVEGAVEERGEKEIYRFLAGPLEMSAEEIEQMPPADFFKALKTLAEENDLRGFFDAVAKLTR